MVYNKYIFNCILLHLCGTVLKLSAPPREVHTKQSLGFVSYFYLWDCFGIVVNFERPKIENASHLNWINQQRDEHGQWGKRSLIKMLVYIL